MAIYFSSRGLMKKNHHPAKKMALALLMVFMFLSCSQQHETETPVIKKTMSFTATEDLKVYLVSTNKGTAVESLGNVLTRHFDDTAELPAETATNTKLPCCSMEAQSLLEKGRKQTSQGQTSATKKYILDPTSGETKLKDVVSKGTETTHCRVYMDTSLTGTKLLSDAEANTLMKKFEDEVYPYVRPLMGEPVAKYYDTHNAMTDTKVNLIIADLPYAGMFYPLDYDENSECSNKGMYLYIGIDDVKNGGNNCYSTMAHEYTHMIHWGIKMVNYSNKSFEPWWTEMMAVLTEDMFDAKYYPDDATIKPTTYYVEPFRAYNGKIPFAVWKDELADNEMLFYYGTTYMLGAFFVHNMGTPQMGIDFVHEMATNDKCGVASFEKALTAVGSGSTFITYLSRFPEAFITTSGAEGSNFTFNNNITGTRDGKSYTFRSLEWKGVPKTKMVDDYTTVLSATLVNKYDYSIVRLGKCKTNVKATVTITQGSPNLYYGLVFTDDAGKIKQVNVQTN